MQVRVCLGNMYLRVVEFHYQYAICMDVIASRREYVGKDEKLDMGKMIGISYKASKWKKNL